MSVEEERMIPVFTVLKNGAVLKNIFVINKPPDESTSEETEEIVIVGRHPDCNIVLMHPSISRFHLQINSKPFSRKLFVTDLSSVHGTWVSEKKVEAGYAVEVKEGDTIKLGGSTRVYRLHWIPLSSAYDSENPFVFPMDLPTVKEEEERGQEAEEDCDNFQDLNLMSVNNRESESSDLILEDISSLFQKESWESILDKEVQYMSFEPECRDGSFYADQDVNSMSDINDEIGRPLSLKTVEEDNLESKDQQFEGQDQSPCHVKTVSENKDVLLVQSEDESSDAVWFDSLLSSEDGELRADTKALVEIVDKHKEVDSFPYEMESFEIPVTLGDHLENKKENEMLRPYEAPQPTYEDANQENFSGDQLAEVSCSSPCKEKCADCKLVVESVNSSMPVANVVSEVIEIRENQTLEPSSSPIENFEVRSEKSSHNIFSRRGKTASGLKLQATRSRGDTKDGFKNQGYSKDKSVTKVLFSSSEEETFTPDKENYSPNTLLLKCLKKQSKSEEVQLSNSYCSPSPKHVFNSKSEAIITFSSDKENQTPKVLQTRKSGSRTSVNRSILGQDTVLKEKRAERLPLRSLLSNYPAKSPSQFSAPTAATRSCPSVSYTQTMRKIDLIEKTKRVWTMVVDTSSLLDKESRKSLQLLQGLKGTQLIIPRMVIRELDCLNRRGSLFRRTTEASLALEWIEECMLNTDWWIHVQSSIEESEQTAPTPPASPHSGSTESKGGFPFWSTSYTSFSPTSEDHIIDYALFSRRLYNNGQLVLVSNDLNLKIKAMAEGLICESGQEFRKSLVNPFSERFMWADSSPRGQTWSVIDDIALKDKYYGSPWKKESTKGLKLILLHNWAVRTH